MTEREETTIRLIDLQVCRGTGMQWPQPKPGFTRWKCPCCGLRVRAERGAAGETDFTRPPSVVIPLHVPVRTGW